MKRSVKFEDIVGQDNTINILKSFIAKNMIYKTLLMIGVDGVGKESAALAFAATYNCENNMNGERNQVQIENIGACGFCRTCKTIAKGYHPDVLHMGFVDATIVTVSDVRYLLNKISMKPYESRHKFVIMPKAHRMNIEASNAFLKFLEEHNERATIILTVPSQMDLIPTIVSRCNKLRFKPIPYKIISTLIMDENLNSEEIKTILELSFGNLTKLKKLSSSKWNDKRKWLISRMSSLHSNTTNGNINKKEWIILSEILSKYKHSETLNDFLLIITLWLRDVLVYKFDPKRIYNLDMEKSIAIASQNISHDVILSNMDTIQAIQQDILKSNRNLKLLIDIILICIQELT